MARGAEASLDKVLGKSLGDLGDMTKSPLLEQSWESQVAAYVQDLVAQKII
jgi:hypothetical protein